VRIEAFSEGKYLDDPDANEDQFLVLPGRGFAVIDGVTDISGRAFEGMRTAALRAESCSALPPISWRIRTRPKTLEALIERVSGGAARRVRPARHTGRRPRRSAKRFGRHSRSRSISDRPSVSSSSATAACVSTARKSW
jgi:hypothetical protein